MKKINVYMVSFLSLLLSACKKDESLNPPSEGKKVLIEVRLPEDLEVKPLGVMYRSTICHHKRMNASGERVKHPGFNFIEMNFKREKGGNEYSLLVPSDGGGQCDWKLSNITIKVEYKMDAFKEKIDNVVGTGVIIIFDDNGPQRDDGVYKYASGDMYIDLKYFPWIDESFINGHSKELWTYGNKIFVNYKTKDTDKIIFSPVSFTNLITYSTGPKFKKPSGENFTRFVYPDGTVVENGGPFPDFKKLEAIAGINNK